MENYEQEKAFCEAERFGQQAGILVFGMSLPKILSRYKAYLIEQAKEGKMTMLECLDKVSIDQEYKSWADACNKCRDNVDLNYIPQTAGKIYANQFIQVAPAEQWISVKDRLPTEGQRVLICQSENYMQCTDFRKKSFSIVSSLHEEPTHWMPLPTAPELTT